MEVDGFCHKRVSKLLGPQASPLRLSQLWLLPRSAGDRGAILSLVTVAVDLMGGDDAPGVVVQGIAQYLEAYHTPVIAVGTVEALDLLTPHELLERREASEVIEMDEDPASAPRRKRDSSMVRAAELVKSGIADAMVTAGNSGAAMAVGLLKVGRIRGIARPAIATELPVPGETSTILLDAGANADVLPQWLHQFGVMGSVYASARLKLSRPRVGILSIGEEPGKGSSLVKEAFGLLSGDPHINFIGNVEGRDVLTNRVDVVVTDGFTGNVVLKTLEGAAHLFAGAVLGALANKGEDAVFVESVERLMPLWNEMTPDATGAAALLGVDGLCLIGHGSSNPRAIVSALRNAHDLAAAGVVQTMNSIVW